MGNLFVPPLSIRCNLITMQLNQFMNYLNPFINYQYITAGIAFFAECLRHSAKAILHSAKPLLSVTLGKKHSAKRFLPSTFFRTLGKLRIEKIKKNSKTFFFNSMNNSSTQQNIFLNSRNNSPTLALSPYPLPYHFSLLF
jgi:hypothetical protein